MKAQLAILLLALILLRIPASAQAPPPDRAADSLLAIWNDSSRPDTVRLMAVNRFVSKRFASNAPDSLLHYGQLIRALAARKGLKKYMASAMMWQSRSFSMRGDQQKSIVFLDSAIAFFEEAHDLQGQAGALNNKAIGEIDHGDLARAIADMTHSLKISEALKDSSLMARTLGNIGTIYYTEKDYKTAMSYYEQRRVIAEAIGQKDILAEVLMNIGIIQQLDKEYDKALASYERSLTMIKEIGHKPMELVCLSNIASLRAEQGDREQAMELERQALGVAEEIGDSVGIADAYSSIGDTYREMGDLGQAFDYGQRGLAIAQEMQNINSVRDAANLLYKVQKAKGNDREALAMHELYITSNDSVLSSENKEEIMHQRFQYDYDKKEALLQAEQDKKDAVAAEELRRKNLQRNAFIGGFGLMLLLAGVFFTQRNRISKEKKRSEELLLNILPEEVAEELKATGAAAAKHFDEATILFTDFKGFTSLSEQLSPAELVEELNTCFKAFDHIVTNKGIEKIKTIGDAYMCAGGLPDPKSSSPTSVVHAALEMQAFMISRKSERDAQGKPAFEMRVGIHTGPVVAGIVGVKKFAYDIWGDTVNIASRMESSGEVGQVNISESTYALVNGETGLMFTARGKVQAKGKGEMEMYFAFRASSST